VGAQGLGDPHAVSIGTVEGQLEGAEQASRARNRHRDEAKLSEVLLPFLVADTLGLG